MRFRTCSHRYGEALFQTDERLKERWLEIEWALGEITDEAIIEGFEQARDVGGRPPKSISMVVNGLLKDKLVVAGWEPESPIFRESEYQRGSRWRLDFAKDDVSVEVAFNHGEAAAWNLLKPVLASELNHVRKAIQTKAGVLVTATDALKEAGGFDSAVGSYEKYLGYLRPLSTVLTVPMVVVGLDPPASFRIVHEKDAHGRMCGRVVAR